MPRTNFDEVADLMEVLEELLRQRDKLLVFEKYPIGWLDEVVNAPGE